MFYLRLTVKTVETVGLYKACLACVTGMMAIKVTTSKADLEIVTMIRIVMVIVVDRVGMVTKTATTTEDTTELQKSHICCGN